MTDHNELTDSQTGKDTSHLQLLLGDILEPLAPLVLQLLWLAEPAALMIDRHRELQRVIGHFDENVSLDSQEVIHER